MDDETRAICVGYAGRDFDKPREVVIEVFEQYGSEDWSLDGFLAEINAAVAKIPPEKRTEAKVELEGGYEESTKLRIWYCGMESAADVQERVDRCLKYARERQDGERAAYERLKRKFG